MIESPRYPAGRRQVLVKHFVKSASPQSANYMEIDFKGNAGEKFVSHKAAIKSVNEATGEIVVCDPAGAAEAGGEAAATSTREVTLQLRDVLELNQPHVFAEDILGNLVFEDGLKCDYRSVDTKLKLIEICFALAPLIGRLDFTQDPLAALDTQLECIRTIRRCLNIVTFDKGEVKTVLADRHKTGTTGKLALNGQGNCHGCSSTMAAFLYPFRNILGIDLKYRGGYSFGGLGEGDSVSNEIERHQWLEVTCRPSMETFICDLWYEGVHEDAEYLTTPIDLAYSGVMYPNGKLIIHSRSQGLTGSDL